MKNKNKNIDKFFSGKLPDPEIPADDAWGKMNDMLTPQVSARKPGSLFKIISNSTLILISGLTLLGVTILGIVLYINKENDSPVQASLKNKESISTQKNMQEQTANNESFVKKQSSLHPEPLAIKEEYAGKKAAESEAFSANKAVKTSETQVSNETLTGAGAPEFVAKRGNRQKDFNIANPQSLQREALIEQKKQSTVRKGNSGDKMPYAGQNATEYDKRNEALAPSFLSSLPFRTSAYNFNLSNKIKAKPESHGSIVKNAPEKTGGNSFQVGLEWNVNAPFKQTEFLFNSIDSVKKPATLLIPGIWVAKSFRDKHQLTLSLQAQQPYFGNNKRLAQATDTIPGVDSAHWYRNTDLVKTVGLNVSLQYQFQFVNRLSVGAGLVYSRTLGALVQMQTFNRNDKPLEGQFLSLKGRKEFDELLNANVFFFKAGLAYKISRFEAGINILAPVRSISVSPSYSIREVNGQFVLRFRVW